MPTVRILADYDGVLTTDPNVSRTRVGRDVRDRFVALAAGPFVISVAWLSANDGARHYAAAAGLPDWDADDSRGNYPRHQWEAAAGKDWWKLRRARSLRSSDSVCRLVWVDDQLNQAAYDELGHRDDTLLVRPDGHVGLTHDHLDQVRAVHRREGQAGAVAGRPAVVARLTHPVRHRSPAPAAQRQRRPIGAASERGYPATARETPNGGSTPATGSTCTRCGSARGGTPPATTAANSATATSTKSNPQPNRSRTTRPATTPSTTRPPAPSSPPTR